MRVTQAVALLTLCAGCAPKSDLAEPQNSPFPGHGNEPGRLTWSDRSDPRPVFIGNGNVGAWFGRDGSGSGQKITFAGDVTSASPHKLNEHPSPFAFTIEGVSLENATNYEQSYDLSRGALTTRYSVGATTVETIGEPTEDGVSLTVSVTGEGTPVFAEVASHLFLHTKDSRPDQKSWRREMETADRIQTLVPKIRIDGPIEDQQAVSSFLLNLSHGVSPKGLTAPFGLSNQKYGARAFWDSDTWMFPALALLDPNRAASIPKFRLATRGAAEKAAFDWASHSREQFHPSVPPFKFPWEAGLAGDEQAPGESRKQEHVTGDVAFCAATAGALGLISEQEAKLLIEGCGQYLWHRATRLPDGQWGVLDTMSPDEFHTGDNDLYTNVLTEWTLRRAFPDRWKQMSFKRPKDEQGLLTYDGDTLKNYKQAAALLAVWPLQDPACEAEAVKMLDRFSGKSVRNGPAMTASVEALVRARFGDREAAYEEWRTSWQKYTNRPLMMFSESPNGRNAYFLTGAAGCLNTVLYGFIGLRIDSKGEPNAPWKMPLKSGYWISCRPSLPKAWQSVTIDGLVVLGKRYRLHATGGTVTVTPMK